MKGMSMDTKILDQLKEAFGEELELANGDLEAMERLVKEKMQILGNGLLQRLVDRHNNGYKGGSIICKCGNSMRFVQHRSKDIHTVFGWIRLKRAYYHCPDCGRSLIPYDLESGLGGEQLSPALAKACCLLAVDDSFAQVSAKLQQLFGLRVSERSVERVVHRVGSVALSRQNAELERFSRDRQTPESQSRPQRLYIAPDGTTVHETDGWHEAKVGCIYWQNTRFERQRRYVARLDDSETFGWHLWLEACRCGLRQAQELVYIGDGAGWIRSQYEQHFSRAVFIIDWYHASEHVWDCGKTLFGEGTKPTEDWVKKRLDWLWDGSTRKLLDDLKRQRKKYRTGKREAIDALIRYISSNEEQMRYDVFRSKGYDIGSGAVEGACKNAVGKRLKQSGMIWSRTGSSSTLALRVCWLNKDWDELWRQKPLAA